eukprot:gene17847-9553_t
MSFSKQHRNARKRKEGYIRTKSSLLRSIKDCNRSMRPKPVVTAIQNEAVDPYETACPSDIVRDITQIYKQTRIWLTDHHPGIVTGLSVSALKQKKDYLYLSQQLRTHGKLENLVSGTDGEPAIERAFEKSFQLK